MTLSVRTAFSGTSVNGYSYVWQNFVYCVSRCWARSDPWLLVGRLTCLDDCLPKGEEKVKEDMTWRADVCCCSFWQQGRGSPPGKVRQLKLLLRCNTWPCVFWGRRRIQIEWTAGCKGPEAGQRWRIGGLVRGQRIWSQVNVEECA